MFTSEAAEGSFRPISTHDPTRRSDREPTRRSADFQQQVDQASAKSAPQNGKWNFHQYTRKADVLFVLDCTASMQGELDAIRDSVISFVETVLADGVQTRVGLIEFRDRLIDEEHRALLFDGKPFTNNATNFQTEVAKLSASGGGDEPESSLDAILFALRQPFDPEATRIIVLVTDAPPHVPDKEARTVAEVSRAIKEAGIKQFHMVIRTQEAKNQVYLQLLHGTQGMAFELGRGDDFRSRANDFKRTLLNLGKTITRSR
jgi:Mg-chelatase subunit ChlD